MDTLRSKYKGLRAREIDIKRELSRARTMPTIQVLSWLDEVENLRNQAKKIEKSFGKKKARDFSAYELSRKMDQHQQASPPLNGLTVQKFRAYVDECPERSMLYDTIRQNLRDPKVGIISIYGCRGVGKAKMTEVSTDSSILSTFDLIITVSVSRAFCLHTVQRDIALQMDLDLPAHERAAVILEAFQKCGRFLIIFDDLWQPIPLLEMGIPQPTNGSKIVLITGSFDVCPPMKPNKVIRIGTYSPDETWDMFVETAGNKFLAPERSKLLGTISENLMDPSVGIINIYGYEGVGKTTAMTKVSTQLSKSGIFDSIITVSMGLSLLKVQSDIAMQMNLDLPANDDYKAGAAVLHEAFQNIEKFLIIFDDLKEPIPLLEMGIPQPIRGDGSKIVLISRSFDVCCHMKQDRVIRIDPLSPSEKWDMFVERSGNTVLAPEIRPFAEKIVDICPNFPFMVTMIGHAMRDESSIQVWENVLHNLYLGQGREENILRICYSRLNNETVQNCFLYCALFPQGHLFKSEELIKYWIGEGFMNNNRNIVTEIDDGFRTIRELVDAKMLEMFIVNEDDRLKVPQVCRNLAIDIMKKEPRCWVNNNLVGARKVSLIESRLERLDYCLINCENVSSILVNSNPILCIFNSYFYRMHALSLLDLSHTCLEELPQSLSQLVKLRALFLQYCRSLSRIPSLKEMKELQLIDLTGTSITELPEGMEGMVSLRSLNLSETTKLEKIRSGLLSSLTGLEELMMQGSGLCKMDSPMVAKYLKEMRCLKRLAILNISTVSCIDLLDTVVCLQEQNLQIYSINLYGSTSDYSEDV